MAMIRFAAADIENHLADLDQQKLDDLAFGAILLDGRGTIVSYNAAESAITGRDPQDVIGLNFFKDIAPCTNLEGFRGKFDVGVKSGMLNEFFEWMFNYQMVPTKVQVHMKRAALQDRYWVFVKRL